MNGHAVRVSGVSGVRVSDLPVQVWQIKLASVVGPNESDEMT